MCDVFGCVCSSVVCAVFLLFGLSGGGEEVFENFVGLYEGEEDEIIFLLACAIFGEGDDKIFHSWLFYRGILSPNCSSLHHRCNIFLGLPINAKKFPKLNYRQLSKPLLIRILAIRSILRLRSSYRSNISMGSRASWFHIRNLIIRYIFATIFVFVCGFCCWYVKVLQEYVLSE